METAFNYKLNKKIETDNLMLIACERHTLNFALGGNQQLFEHVNVIVPENWIQFKSKALRDILIKIKWFKCSFFRIT